MRGYTVATAALALRVKAKWLDNLLSHHDVPGVVRGRQGVSRRLPPHSILVIDVARHLIDDLSIPAHRGLELAAKLVAGSTPELDVSPRISLRLDTRSMAAELRARLDEAAEIAAVPRRGRRPAQNQRTRGEAGG